MIMMIQQQPLPLLPGYLESRKLNDGNDGLEQENRLYALYWATKVNGRNGLSSGSLQAKD